MKPDVYTGSEDMHTVYGTPVYVDGEIVAVIVDERYWSAVEDAVIKESADA